MPTVIIKKRTGAVIPREYPGDQPLSVVGGINITLEGTDNLILLQCDHDPGAISYYYQQNFDAITKREDRTTAYHEEPFAFSDGLQGYYMTSINGVTPLLRTRIVADENDTETVVHTADIALNGGATLRLTPYTDTEGSPDAYGVSLADVGRPDIDCPDYVRLIDYLNRIKAVLDSILTQIKGTPSLKAGQNKADTYGFHKQYQAARVLWNYLVHTMSLSINMSQQDAAVYMQLKISHRFGGEDLNLNENEQRKSTLVISAKVVHASMPTTIRLKEITKITRDAPGNPVGFTSPDTLGDFRQLSVNNPLTWTVYPTSNVTMVPEESLSCVLNFDLRGTTNKGTVLLFNVTWRVPKGDTFITIAKGRFVCFSTDVNTPIE